MTTAIFLDPHAGRVEMTVQAVRGTRAGKRAPGYRWVPANPDVRVATGLDAMTFPSIERAVSVARRHVLFSGVA